VGCFCVSITFTSEISADTEDFLLLHRIWTAGELENDSRTERTGQGGMVVPRSLQKNMVALRDARPGLKEKYEKLPFE
jgi:hypothetical protein